MPSCVAGGAQLEPPVRVARTVYLKSLYHIAGQDYCRHHALRVPRWPPASSPRSRPALGRW